MGTSSRFMGWCGIQYFYLVLVVQIYIEVPGVILLGRYVQYLWGDDKGIIVGAGCYNSVVVLVWLREMMLLLMW